MLANEQHIERNHVEGLIAQNPVKADVVAFVTGTSQLGSFRCGNSRIDDPSEWAVKLEQTPVALVDVLKIGPLSTKVDRPRILARG